jgi:hypothetical protein
VTATSDHRLFKPTDAFEILFIDTDHKSELQMIGFWTVEVRIIESGLYWT